MILTLANGEPTLINFNEVVAVTQSTQSFVVPMETRVYFGSGTFGNNSISVKDKVPEIAEKMAQCNASVNAEHRWNFLVK